IDLVLELPLVFSVRSAYYFARYSLMMLAKTGLVTHLAFGSESGRQQELQTIAHILADEPAEYRQQLKAFLQQGYSFPAARSQALQAFLGNDDRDFHSMLPLVGKFPRHFFMSLITLSGDYSEKISTAV